MRLLINTFFVLILLIYPLTAYSSSKGTSSFLCAVTRVLECLPQGKCIDVLPEQAGIPAFVKVDLKNKQIADIGNKNPRTSKIDHVADENDHVIIHGIEDKRAWSMRLDKMNGKISASVNDTDHVFVLFGNFIPWP